MKKILYSGLILAAGLAMTACSGDEPVKTITNDGLGAEITLQAQFPDAADETRVGIAEEDGALVNRWAEGDRLLIADANGNNVGTLNLVEGDGGKTVGTFRGRLSSDLDNGTYNFTFSYIGHGNEPQEVATSPVALAHDSQAGTFADINRYMLFAGQAKYKVVNGTSYLADENGIAFSHLVSYAHFELIFPAGVSLDNGSVTISGANFKSNASLDIAAGSLTGLTEGALTVNNTNGDFYVAIIPSTDADLTFTCTINNVNYTGTLAGKTLRAGHFYREAHANGIDVVMKAEETVDHSKNPLLKWADGDLVYNPLTGKNTIAADYTVRGSLYQWGRVYGWSDYKDAMGDFNNDGPGHEYATYGDFYKDATGLTGGYDHTSVYSYDNKNEDFAEPIYFMNPHGTDYWIGSDNSTTWEQRQAKTNYNVTLVPEGYRLPTQADFLEITPKKTSVGSSNLANVLNGLDEIKTNRECTYAIRWNDVVKSGIHYLMIEALVVPSSYTDADLGKVNWSDANVKTLYLRANGAIHAFYHRNVIENGSAIDYFHVGRPMPLVETHKDMLKTTSDNIYYTITYDYIVDYAYGNEGYYWMSDQKRVYSFVDNTKAKTVAAFSSRQSLVGVQNFDPQDCAAIRLIRK